MITDLPAKSHLSSELQAQRESFYADLPRFGMGPLWAVLSQAMTAEPRVASVPYIWRWKDVRPRVLRSGELVTAEEAERRVLMLLNPAFPERSAVTATLYAGIQLVLPGEVARTHHHTPNAIRFIIEGTGYTTVDGEKTEMEKGDFVTTPIWAWHQHGNESDGPIMWLDGLDMPLVLTLDAMFFEEYPDTIQPVSKPAEDSANRWGQNMRPAWQEPAAEGIYSPVLNYRWRTTRAALHALRDDPASPFDGVILEYLNPTNGRPVLPTMSSYLQLLRKGEQTQAHRHVSSTCYHVAEGGGYTIIAGERFDWEEGDTFVVPAWAWHEHASQQGEAVLFSFSDRPVLRAFGLEREQAHPAGHQ